MNCARSSAGYSNGFLIQGVVFARVFVPLRSVFFTADSARMERQRQIELCRFRHSARETAVSSGGKRVVKCQAFRPTPLTIHKQFNFKNLSGIISLNFDSVCWG